MRSTKPLGRTSLLLPLSLMLFSGLSACVTPIVVTQAALPCRQVIEASNLLNDTPGAKLPQTWSIGEIGRFADRQTGQLDKANADKHGVRELLTTCDDEQKKALTASKKKLRHKVLGIF